MSKGAAGEKCPADVIGYAGVRARTAPLMPKERSAIARNAATTRWE